jgi:hypothetical protein
VIPDVALSRNSGGFRLESIKFAKADLFQVAVTILDFYECTPPAFRLIAYGVTSARSMRRGALSSR